VVGPFAEKIRCGLVAALAHMEYGSDSHSTSTLFLRLAEVCAMRSYTEKLANASLPVGSGLIAWEVFQWIIRRIDDYSRWEAFMSLQQYSGIFSAPWFTPCALVAAVLLLLVNQQITLNRALVISQSRSLVDVNNDAYPPRISYRWFWVMLCVIAVALLAGTSFSILWLRFYVPPNPPLTQSLPSPHICKTDDCWPKPHKSTVISSISNKTSGPYSPIVPGSGNIITYANLGPESATPEQKKEIRIALGNFMRMGETLRDRCSSDPPASHLEAEADAWFVKVRAYLIARLDSSFDVQFEHITATAMEPGAVPHDRVGLWKGIDQRIETLNKFIDEFK
jgi:hypothetical protein